MRHRTQIVASDCEPESSWEDAAETVSWHEASPTSRPRND
jgi:hypothetical protein